MGAEQTYALERELNLLDPKGVRLYLDEFKDLTLEVKGGEVYKAVSVLRAFPLTAGDRFIALRDSEGKEIGIVQNLGELDSESRKVLTAELERVYFVSQILMVNGIDEQFHVPKWDVETDRGRRVFEVRIGRREVRELGNGRVLVRDADGNQYEIRDLRKLDPISQVMVESQI